MICAYLMNFEDGVIRPPSRLEGLALAICPGICPIGYFGDICMSYLHKVQGHMSFLEYVPKKIYYVPFFFYVPLNTTKALVMYEHK